MNEDSEGAIANVSDASLFRIDAPYYLASSKDTATLWSVATDGNITSLQIATRYSYFDYVK